MKEKTQYLLLIIYTFLFIYYPPIFFINTLHILGIISWIIILCHKNEFLKLFPQGVYFKEIIFSLIMCSYLYTNLLFNCGNNYLIIYTFVILVIEILPISFTITYFIKKASVKRSFSDLIIHVGFLQSLISILTFLIPQLQKWVINTMISYGYDSIIIRLSEHRMFGLSYTFPYSMPIVQGVLACFTIYLGIRKNAKYFIYTPFLIFSGIINARICIVIISIGIVLIILDSLSMKARQQYKVAIFAIVLVFLFNPILNLIQEVSPMTYMWLYDGGSQLINLFYGDKTGSYTNYVTDSANYKLPEGLKIIFGTSNVVIRGNSNYQSDVGYVNDIWMGGIVYALAIYSYLFLKLKIIRKSLKKNFMNFPIVSLYLLLVMIFSNVKGTIYSVNEFINLFYLIYIYVICSPSDIKKGVKFGNKRNYFGGKNGDNFSYYNYSSLQCRKVFKNLY